MPFGILEMAREGNSAVVTALSTAATNVLSEITSTVTTVLPIAAGVLSLTIAVYFGIKFIKKVTK